MGLKEAVEEVLSLYYNDYVKELEEDHDELLAEVKALLKEIKGFKMQVSFYKGKCAELEKQPKDEDYESLKRDRERYRDMALKIKKERDDLQERYCRR